MPVYPRHKSVLFQIEFFAHAVVHHKTVLVGGAIVVIEDDHFHVGGCIFQVVLHPAPHVRVRVSAQIIYAVHHRRDHIVDFAHLERIAYGSVHALEVRLSVSAFIYIVVIAYGVTHGGGHIFTVHAGKMGAQAVLVADVARMHDERRVRFHRRRLYVLYPLAHAVRAYLAVRNLQEGVLGVVLIPLFQSEIVALAAVARFYVVVLRPISGGNG